ncbi:protein quiver [Caerostris darwini]|uniref:Protein quiver n=1 Tax=Caerostris darwini TaxID=1538125 RepID=A0AAV4QF18_9ARAC|nr:protein quiver [Caerostris darwini]
MGSMYFYVPLFTILGSLISQGNCVKCYFCSFSPYDRNNRTDKCTEENFQHHNVYSDECKLGCESVVQYDANDEMEQWKRNCLQEGHKLTNDCETEKTPVMRIVRCTCDRDLCNVSVRIQADILCMFPALITLIWRWYSKL